MSIPTARRAWTLLVPSKPPAGAKSRLRGAVPGMAHEELVEEIATATIAAARASSLVQELIVVTDPCGLNEALDEAALAVTGPVAALLADVPALRTAELTEALDQALRQPARRSFVPDASGTGTVLLAARGGPLEPRFGPGSAAAHLRSGAMQLTGDWPTLRRDVDTADDLTAAIQLGWQLPVVAGTDAGVLREWR